MIDTDNWLVENKSFNIISNAYGTFPADRFANNSTKKANKFNPKYFFDEHPTLKHLQTIGVVTITGLALSFDIVYQFCVEVCGFMQSKRDIIHTYLTVFVLLAFNLPSWKSDDRFREATCHDRAVLNLPKSTNLCLVVILNLKH